MQNIMYIYACMNNTHLHHVFWMYAHSTSMLNVGVGHTHCEPGAIPIPQVE